MGACWSSLGFLSNDIQDELAVSRISFLPVVVVAGGMEIFIFWGGG